jgi:hypothetical protein
MALAIKGKMVQIMMEALLTERGRTHGNWIDNARIAQSIKELWRREEGWKRLSVGQREALEYIAGKVARILAGNPNHADHWADLAGYARLVVKELGDG